MIDEGKTYRTKSITTRIETILPPPRRLRTETLIVQSPLQQGLKLSPIEARTNSIVLLIVQSPLQQGLKLNSCIKISFWFVCLIVQSPLQQGLKQKLS